MFIFDSPSGKSTNQFAGKQPMESLGYRRNSTTNAKQKGMYNLAARRLCF